MEITTAKRATSRVRQEDIYRIVQYLQESRKDKRRFERGIKTLSKKIHWYLKTRICNPQELTREDHESFSENIEERESLRLWWEDRNLNTKYLEEELVIIGVGERSIEYINEEETVESELEARKQKLKRKIRGRY